MKQSHCGGRKYFQCIDEMHRADSGDLDEFVHWSDYTDALDEIESLRWLVEIQELKMHNLRRPGKWAPKDASGSELNRAWNRHEDSRDELQRTYIHALAALNK